ncbi:hypothetical protein ACQ5SO_05025 [Rhodovulum sp. DZ06]|uniref:hypothetical protein n=1 Tax=Rhodovulum sp. DZ06 TaxID=3425126 RepID=UPI003D336716
MRYGSDFAAVAFRTGEGSNQGGLTAHWLIKGALPAAFAPLGAGALLRAGMVLNALLRGRLVDLDADHDR